MDNKFNDNQQLLEEVAKGNAAAESELVNNYAKSLRFILSRRCDDSNLVADFVQDTFIVVIGKARKREILNPEALAAFVRQTGINIMLGHFRKERRRATDAFGEVNVEIPDLQTDVSKAVETNETVALVEQLMNEMRVERDRDILHSYFVKEEAKQDICMRLSLTPAHFDRVLFRARERLKQLIQFKLGGGGVFDQ